MPVAGTTFKLVTAARLIDGCNETPLEGGAILFEGSRIRQVGPAGEVRAPEGAEVEKHHFEGATILPGLIDAHTHFNYRGDGTHTDEVMKLSDDILLMRSIAGARTHLESGVTTVRENGAKHHTAFSLREGNRLGLVSAPRMLVCGRPITITGGHMWQMGSEADGVDGMRKAVRQLIKERADWIKVPATGGSTSTSYPLRESLGQEELNALVEEAHKFGKLVGTHCLATSGIVNSLEAGVDMIIHSHMREPDGTWSFRPEVADRIAREGRWVNPTIHNGRARLWAMEQATEIAAPEDHGIRAKQSSVEKLRVDVESRFEEARRLLQAGVRLIPGTDAAFGWYPFGQLWRELECFAEVGMSPMRALLAATRDSAEAIGVSSITGTLEVGKEADVLVVQGNPAEELRALTQVLTVFLGGTEVRRELRALAGQ